MQEETEDRRIKRTREDLIGALLALIEEKHYDQISVQDIVLRANVGRSTFYSHFQSKDDLLMFGFAHQLDALAGLLDLDEGGRIRFEVTRFFEHASMHFEIYRTLLWGSGFGLLTQSGHTSLSRRLEARLRSLSAREEDTNIPLSMIANLFAGAILITLKWWLDEKMPYPAEKMNEFFQVLVMPGMRGLGVRSVEVDPGAKPLPA